KLEGQSINLVLEKDFKTFSDRVMQSSKALPDTRTVLASAESSESISIPVRRLTQYYLEYNFLSPLHDEIEGFSKSLQDNVVNINDQLSLTLFSIDNSNADDIAAPQIIANAIDEITQEESAARKNKHELSLGFGALGEKLFQALTVNAMVAASVEFGYISRDARQKKVISKIDRLGRTIRKFFIDKIL